MTIEIHSPELEGLLQRRLSAGKFASLEDLLLQTLREKTPLVAGADDSERLSRARLAADRIRELREGVSLQSPPG
jgi:hypothetical protein